jgi:hypothetical protein
MGNSELPVDDSMPPHKSGFFIVGRYVKSDVMDGKTYILLTKNEGIVYKRLNKTEKNWCFIWIMPIINPMK